MNRKIVGIITIIIVICAIGMAIFLLNRNMDKEEKKSDNEEIKENSNASNTNKISSKKVLVVYYSAQNHTKEVAEKIAKNLNTTTFELEPENKYTSSDLDWTDSESRVSKEHNDESLRNVKLVTTTVSD